MVHRFREEEPAGFAGARLIIDPSKKVFVQEVEQEESRTCEAVDDRRYDGIAQRNYDQLGHRREERAPFRCDRRVLGLVHRARGGIKKDHLDIIHLTAAKWEHSRQEESGRFWQILSQK